MISARLAGCPMRIGWHAPRNDGTGRAGAPGTSDLKGTIVDLQLADKIAVVTGANKGIGLAVTNALVDEGAFVVAGSRSTDNLDGLDRVTAVPGDLASSDGPAQLVARAIDEHGRLDVLVNNVGAPAPTPHDETPVDT